MSYQQDLEQQQQNYNNQQAHAESLRAWDKICVKYPHVANHLANLSIVESYMEPLPVSVSGFELLLSNPKFVAQLDVRQEDEQKKSLMAQIETLLAGKAIYVYSKQAQRSKLLDLNQVRFNLPSMSTVDLKNLLDQITESQAMNKQSPEQIRQRIQAAQLQPGTPVMPLVFVPYGHVQSVPLDRDAIRAMDVDEIRMLIRKYGEEQVNARLNGLD